MNVFVYGTLMQGFNNHYILENAVKREATTITLPPSMNLAMYSLYGGYPGVLQGLNHSTPIMGELYELTDDKERRENAVARMDVLEGHPNFYQRMEFEHEGLTFQTYILNPKYKAGAVITNGNWREHKNG